MAGVLVSRIQAALGFGSSRWNGREELYLLAFTGCSPLGHLGNKQVPSLGSMGRDLMGLLYPSNLLSFLPHAQRLALGPAHRAWPAGPKMPRKAADRWELLGAWPWLRPGIASTSVFETSPYLPGQSMLLVPVPTGPRPPWHLPADMMGEAVGELSGRKLVVPGDRGQESTQLPHSFFLGCIKLSCLIYFLIFFQIE